MHGDGPSVSGMGGARTGSSDGSPSGRIVPPSRRSGGGHFSPPQFRQNSSLIVRYHAWTSAAFGVGAGRVEDSLTDFPRQGENGRSLSISATEQRASASSKSASAETSPRWHLRLVLRIFIVEL